MTTTLLISHQGHCFRIASLKGGHVTDVDLEDSTSKPDAIGSLDQIYWGRVTHVENTHAFVRLSPDLVGLLPFETHVPRLHVGQAVLVQVRREAMPDKGSTHKGPLLTRHIFLGGRYCLFHPFQPKRILSSKIQDPLTRSRLETRFPSTTPITLRQAAAEASFDQIQEEIDDLQSKFLKIKAAPQKVPSPTAYDAVPTSYRLMRDMEAAPGNAILVDHEAALAYVRHFLKSHRPDLLPFVEKHKSPLFEAFGLEEFWESLFQEVVDLPGGGNIVIEVTAAATVIDVNHGNNAFQDTNKEAVPVLVQQLKSRHLGGNIIIDFMGVDSSSQDRVHLKEQLSHYASVYTLPLDIFGWSKLGWMEARLPKRRLPLKDTLTTIENRNS